MVQLLHGLTVCIPDIAVFQFGAPKSASIEEILFVWCILWHGLTIPPL